MAALPVGAELPLFDKTLQLLQLAPEDPHSPSRFIVSSVSRDFDMRDPNAVMRLVTINAVNGAVLWRSDHADVPLSADADGLLALDRGNALVEDETKPRQRS